jgi:NitT/TauT family transport system ATP-binding protein
MREAKMDRATFRPVTDATQSVELIALRGVGKVYTTGTSRVVAIKSVSLAITAGEFVSIVGPSGCGKSTLLQIVAGLLPCSSGEALLDGYPISGPPDGMVCLFQEYSRSLFPWLTVEGNVRFGFRHLTKLHSVEAMARCHRYLEMVGLSEFRNSYPWQLSGGMQQRVAIARALAAEPRVLLLDEPFSSVDALTRLELHGLILDIWEKSRLTILLVTHDVEEAVYLSDRIALFTRRPAEVAEVFPNPLARPRHPVQSRDDPQFGSLRHELLSRLLSRT